MGLEYKIRSEEHVTLREKLIVLRDKAGLSQMVLANQIGVSRQAVSRWESGDATPSVDKLKALAKIYCVSLDWLCSDGDEPEESKEKIELLHTNITDEAKTYFDKEREAKRVKRMIAIVAVVLGVLISACILFIKTRQKSKPIEELPYKTIDPKDSSDVDSFGFDW